MKNRVPVSVVGEKRIRQEYRLTPTTKGGENGLDIDCNNCGAKIAVPDKALEDDVELLARKEYVIMCKQCGVHFALQKADGVVSIARRIDEKEIRKEKGASLFLGMGIGSGAVLMALIAVDPNYSWPIRLGCSVVALVGMLLSFVFLFYYPRRLRQSTPEVKLGGRKD
jgi:transcription elongation factor Elf1